MTDDELRALTVIVQGIHEECRADNEQRLRQGYAPMWGSDCLPCDEEVALRQELERRGVLKKTEPVRVELESK